jgi:hypothetical protein
MDVADLEFQDRENAGMAGGWLAGSSVSVTPGR